MEAKIRAYVESLFRTAPPSQQSVELQEELIQNLNEKYNDLLAGGKSQEAAYNIAIASIGDISSLLADLGGQTVAPPVPMPEINEKQRRKSAILTAVAVCMYILCVVPCIVFENEWGVVLMFLMIAGATGLLIYNSSLKKNVYTGEGVAADFQQWRQVNGQKGQIFSVISVVLTVLVISGYFLISFGTGAWYITWLIFPIGGAVRKAVRTFIFEVID